jgi:succinate dehydrogenase / fumarate reductase cytochrome b subunit
MAKNNQPLSPHLSIYKWQITNTLSILHRFSGALLFLAAIDFSIWLASIAIGENSYALISGLSSNWPALVYWVVVSFSFFYHSLNGLRHLAWDFGKGFDTHKVNYSGFIVVVLTLVLTLCFWFFLLTKYSF